MTSVVWRSPTTRLPSGGYKRSLVAAEALVQARPEDDEKASLLCRTSLHVTYGLLVRKMLAEISVRNAVEDRGLAMAGYASARGFT